jgi:hypothetical protein
MVIFMIMTPAFINIFHNIYDNIGLENTRKPITDEIINIDNLLKQHQVPLVLDREKSIHDSLIYYDSIISIYFIDSINDGINKEQIKEIINILPSNSKGYDFTINYEKVNQSISLRIDNLKVLRECNPYETCKKEGFMEGKY